MKNITFGMQGLSAATPKNVKLAYRILMLLSTIWVLTIQPNMEFSEHVNALVNKWMLVGNGVFYQVCQFFGYAESETPNGQG